MTDRGADAFRRRAYAAPERDDARIRAFHGRRARAHASARPADDRRALARRSSPARRTHMPDYPQEGTLRGGHIPGARSVPWARAANPDGTFKTADELRAIYEGEAGAARRATTWSPTAASASARPTPGSCSPTCSATTACATTTAAGPSGATRCARRSRSDRRAHAPGRPGGRGPAGPDAGRGRALQPASRAPGRGARGTAAAARIARARGRRRRSRRTGRDVPGRGGSGSPRPRRLRCGGPLQPPAAAAARHRRHRPIQAGVGARPDRRHQPPCRCRAARGAAHCRQRPRHPCGLRRRRGRHRQLPDPLSHERRRACCSASPTCTAAFFASRGRCRCSRPPTVPVTAVSIRSPHRRGWFRVVPRAGCWASSRTGWHVTGNRGRQAVDRHRRAPRGTAAAGGCARRHIPDHAPAADPACPACGTREIRGRSITTNSVE